MPTMVVPRLGEPWRHKALLARELPHWPERGTGQMQLYAVFQERLGEWLDSGKGVVFDPISGRVWRATRF